MPGNGEGLGGEPYVVAERGRDRSCYARPVVNVDATAKFAKKFFMKNKRSQGSGSLMWKNRIQILFQSH